MEPIFSTQRETAAVGQQLATERPRLVTSALRLSYFTIAWNGLSGAIALVVGLLAGSLAIAGFALNALLDSAASVVLVWRFRHERHNPVAAERIERRAQAWIVLAMLAVGVYVGAAAFHALVAGRHPATSIVGAGIAIASLAVLPFLGRMKLHLARRIASPALRGDGVLTITAATLAAITLTALLVNSALGWWWADPAAALIIAIALLTEALRVGAHQRFG